MQETIIGNTQTLLDGVTATGASEEFDASAIRNMTFQITAASVTTGGTMDIEVSLDKTNWGVISTTSITGNGTTIVTASDVVYKWVRANLSARTDGTYTVIVVR